MTAIESKIIFECGWDERDDFETPAKGHRNDVILELPNGERYKLDFIDPIRLKQEIDRSIELGYAPFYAEPGLIVLHEVKQRIDYKFN